MKLRSLLAATTACALVAAAPAANAEDLYVSVFGGANWLNDDSGLTDSGDGWWHGDSDTGFVLGGTIGTSLSRWAEGLRVEMEASYRRNDIEGDFSETNWDDYGPLNGNMSTFAIMANAWYEVDVGSKVRPYFGGGVGWARMNADLVAVELSSGGSPTGTDFTTADSFSGFAWQLGLGASYEVMNGVDVGLGYRYFRGPDFHDVWEGDDGVIHNENHVLQVELNIDIQ